MTNGIVRTERTYATPENARKALDRFVAKRSLNIDDGGLLWQSEGSPNGRWNVRWLIAVKDGRFAPVVFATEPNAVHHAIDFANAGITIIA